MPPISELDLGKLRQFLELARVGHYGRAAARLSIEQPQLSRTMRRFEQEMGVALLRRHSRGVMITDFGRNLVEVGEAILRSVDRIHAFKTRATASQVGEVVIGLPPRLGPTLTGIIFEGAARLLPDGRVRFIEASSDVLERDTAAGAIDASLLYEPPDISDLVTVPLLEEELAFIFPPAWNLSLPPRPLRLRDAAAYPLILPTVTQGERRLILRAETQHGLRLRPILEIDSPMTLRALVNAGAGSTIANRLTFREDIMRGILSSHSLSDPPLRTILHLAASPSTMALRGTVELIAMIRECVAVMVREGQWPDAVLAGKVREGTGS